MELDTKFFLWIPLVSVGPFKFGDDINNYFVQYRLKQIPEEYNEKVNWDVYALPNEELRIFSENGRIVAVACEKICAYEDLNIIGMKMGKVAQAIRIEPDFIETEELTGGPQDVYDYDALGLQLWLKDGIVVKAICSEY